MSACRADATPRPYGLGGIEPKGLGIRGGLASGELRVTARGPGRRALSAVGPARLMPWSTAAPRQRRGQVPRAEMVLDHEPDGRR